MSGIIPSAPTGESPEVTAQHIRLGGGIDMRQYPGFYSLSMDEHVVDGKTWYVAFYRMWPSWADSSLGSGGECVTRFESAEGRQYFLWMQSARWQLGQLAPYKEKYEELVRQVAAQPGIRKLRKWLRGPEWRD